VKQEIEKIRFGSRILRAGEEAVALPVADRAKPDLFRVELNAQLFKAEIRLNNETLEDSIERDQLRQTIMELMAERIATDTHELVINGDTASVDPFLAQFSGILKQATSHTFDAGGVKLNKGILRDTLRAMPTEFRKNKKALKFLTSSNAELDFRDTLSDRATVMGDDMLENERPVQYSGVNVVPVPLFPENQGAGLNTTSVVLTDPKNINVGIWRQIRIETDKLVSEGVLIVVLTTRIDMKYAHEPAVTKAFNVLAA
jgi:Phage capsid family